MTAKANPTRNITAIVLKKHRPAGSCDFCGEVDEQAIQFGGYCICSACRRKLSAL